MALKQLKPKKCKSCGVMFTPFSGLAKVCSPSCLFVYRRSEKIRKERDYEAKRLREGRERLLTRNDHLKLAQAQFNRFIRLRDSGKPCISCQQKTGAKQNAGHYLTTAAFPELRFNEDNCSKQCEKCNSWLSGNQVAYRVHLIEKIGIERVEALEGPHEPLNLTIPDIKLLKSDYSARANSLAKELDNYSR